MTEAIVIFLGEFVLLALIGCIILLVQGLSGILLGGVRWFSRKKQTVWLKRLFSGFLVLFTVTLVALVLINLFFFDDAARGVMDILHERTGIEIKFREAEGNLFTGFTRLKDVTIRRLHHKTSTFDLSAQEVSLDFDLTALLTLRPRIESLEIKGLEGKFNRRAKVWRAKPRKSYTIERLSLENVNIDFRDFSREGPTFVVSLGIERFKTAPFRSKMAIYDILFHSNGRASVNANPVEIQNWSKGGEQLSIWHFQRFPLVMAAAYFRGPFKYISRADIDMNVLGRRGRVEDKVEDKDGDGIIRTEWKLLLNNIDAIPPGESSGLIHKATYKTIEYLKKEVEGIPIRFSLDFREKDFKNAVSLEGPGIWKRSGKMVLDIVIQLAAQSGDQIKEKLKELGKKSWGKIKGLFKKDN